MKKFLNYAVMSASMALTIVIGLPVADAVRDDSADAVGHVDPNGGCEMTAGAKHPVPVDADCGSAQVARYPGAPVLDPYAIDYDLWYDNAPGFKLPVAY